jgi:carbamoyl-phosphate synthase large subunit
VGTATPERLFELESLLRRGVSVDEVAAATGIDPWFLAEMGKIVDARLGLADQVAGGTGPADLDRRAWRRLKRLGFSDAQLAYVFSGGAGGAGRGGAAAAGGAEAVGTQRGPKAVTEEVIRTARLDQGVRTTFKTVDTCGAEFEAHTPYHYGTYEDEDEVAPSDRPRVIILGSGPNRIGQGIEFDYCCVHASFALQAAGFETIMLNCNPETVSTDYDTSDRLYFEPLTPEDLENVLAAERDASVGAGRLVGVIVSLGGQTPLKLAGSLAPELVLGTSPASIDLAEDRERWNELCGRLGIPQPPGGTAVTAAEAVTVASGIGYPVLVRPSYVLGGRAMEIVYDDERLTQAVNDMAASLNREGGVTAQRPVLVDRFLEDAVEVDVDAIRDATGAVVICGVMEHVEEAGVHSGDSACALPPQTLSDGVVAVLEDHVRAIAEALDVRGLCNVQFAVKDDQAYVIEANPRASRTVPFVAKATGVPVAMVAARVMVGATLAELAEEGLLSTPVGGHVSVKEAVLPFNRFPGVDTLLGPEMRSTGEVMGIDRTFGLAFAKSQIAAGNRLPTEGTVFLSLADRDKAAGLDAARQFSVLGFELAATSGTAAALEAAGIPVSTVVAKVGDPEGEDAVALIAEGKVQLVVNTPRGRGPRADGIHIRSTSLLHQVPCLTTVAAARAAAAGIADWIKHPLSVRSLQEYLGSATEVGGSAPEELGSAPEELGSAPEELGSAPEVGGS